MADKAWLHWSTSFLGFFSVKPRVLQNLKKDDVQNGTSYKLNCSAYGDPALKYSWTINGTRNIPNAIPINGDKTLHINPVTIENEGIYKCLVTNIEGNASTTASITVFGEFCVRFFMVILYTIILARQRELCGAVSVIIWYNNYILVIMLN